VLETFDVIAASTRSCKLQDQRLGAIQRGEPLVKATEKRYDKLKAEMVEQMEGCASTTRASSCWSISSTISIAV